MSLPDNGNVKAHVANQPPPSPIIAPSPTVMASLPLAASLQPVITATRTPCVVPVDQLKVLLECKILLQEWMGICTLHLYDLQTCCDIKKYSASLSTTYKTNCKQTEKMVTSVMQRANQSKVLADYCGQRSVALMVDVVTSSENTLRSTQVQRAKIFSEMILAMIQTDIELLRCI